MHANLHHVSLKPDDINPPSISLQHGLLIGFELEDSVQIKGEIALLYSLREVVTIVSSS